MALLDFLISTPKAPPAPAPVNAGQSAYDFVTQMSGQGLQNQLLNAEQTFRPQYTGLNLQDYQQYLFGQQAPSFNSQAFLQARPDILANFNSDPNYQRQYGSIENYARAAAQAEGLTNQFTSQGQSPGLIGLQGQAAQQLQGLQGQLNTQQRASDLADVEAFGGRASQAFMSANPGLAQQLQNLQGMSTYSGALGYTPQQVQAGTVDQGALGQQLYQQALNAGPSAISQQLEQRGLAALAAGGNLTPEEQRSLQQSVRAAYGSRGNLGGSQAVSAEALARLSGEREREMQNLSIASGINQQLLGELAANRGFSTGVYGQDLGRQSTNVGNRLQADLSNQAATSRASEFGIQAQMGQTAADRAFGLNLAGAYGQTAINPFQAVLGSSSGALGMGGQQVGQAAGLTQAAQGPQLFDPNAGINLGLQNAANLGNYQASTYGAKAGAQGQALGGLLGGVGSIFGGFLAGR